MGLDFKPNFFTGGTKAQVSMPMIQWVNDPQYRAGYGQWLYENFDELAREYKKHGRFLSLQEINEPLD